MRISANDTRGLDVTLDVGAQTETVEVTAEREMIQTETGAREGLIRAEQIENLSIISRSPMELLRILPGVVTTQDSLESVSNGGGANQTNGYNVNGIRGSNNVVTLDGSRMIDIGSNNGLIIAPNTDFVSEVKIQSSNYAAEFGSGGVQVSAITKGGSAEFHGTVYTYMRNHQLRGQRPLELDRGGREAREQVPLSGRQPQRPDPDPRHRLQQEPRQGLLLLRRRAVAAEGGHGLRLRRGAHPNQRSGLFNDYQGGQNLNQPTTVNIPSGFPGAGTPAPGNNLAPTSTPWARSSSTCIRRRTTSTPTTATTTSTTRCRSRTPPSSPCASTTTSRTAPRPTCAWPRTTARWTGPRPLVDLVELRAAHRAQQRPARPVGLVQPHQRALADHDQRVHLQLSKLKLDNRHADESKISLAGLGLHGYEGFFGQQTPFAPVNIYSWGQGLGNLWDPSDQQNIFAYNSSLQFGNNFTKVLNTHALKIGLQRGAPDKNQNFQNDAQPAIVLGAGWIPGTHGQRLRRPARGPAGPGQLRHGADRGTWDAWNFDGFVQDSWKVKKNLTLEYGIRLSKWTNNAEKNALGAVFIPERYDRERRHLPGRGQDPGQRRRLRRRSGRCARASSTTGRCSSCRA